MPISNDPKAKEKADLIQEALSKQGWEVVNPFNIHAGKNPTYFDFICYDLRAMMGCHAIYFCQGWEQSCGCSIEHDVAMRMKAHGKKDFKIMYE